MQRETLMSQGQWEATQKLLCDRKTGSVDPEELPTALGSSATGADAETPGYSGLDSAPQNTSTEA